MRAIMSAGVADWSYCDPTHRRDRRLGAGGAKAGQTLLLFPGRVARFLSIMLAASLMQGLVSSPATSAQLSAAEAARREAWRATMTGTPMPKKGCFTATYPNTGWREVPCTTPPPNPQGPRRGPRPEVVGNGNDVSAQAPSGFISQAIGSFDTVTGVTSETGTTFGSNCSSPVSGVANIFSLQLNANTFFDSSNNVPACSGAAVPTACQGWEQFIYSNTPAFVSAYIQYWLLNFSNPCPAGWTTSGSSCFRNSTNAASVPVQPITNLGNLTLTGAVGGGGDSVSLFDGSTLHMVTGDNRVNLAANWQIAEFNIFGDTCSSQANLNSGSTVVPRTRIVYGGTAAPICVSTGFTGETNNLNFGPNAPGASKPGPAIIFEESSTGGLSACAAATPTSQNEADLAITKTAPATVIAGTALTYSLNVTNLGPDNATNVVVTDALPTGTTFKSSSISCSGSPVTCNLGTLANGLSMSFTITANVPPSFVSPATITNTASVTANETDPNLNNNTASASTAVTASADLALTKTCAPTASNKSSCAIQITNNGPSDAQSVMVTDAITGSVNFTVTSVAGAACTPPPPVGPAKSTTLICSLGTVPAGATMIINVAFTTGFFAGTVSDTATVTSTTPDPNSGNNSGTGSVTIQKHGLRG